MNMIRGAELGPDTQDGRGPRTSCRFGEDAGYFGGVFRVTDQLQQKHGLTRSFDAPISECGIVAAAIGMGAYGLRPVVEIQFADYIYPAYDQIVSRPPSCATARPASSPARSPSAAPYGGGIFGGQTHSQSPESLFTHIAGLEGRHPVQPLRRQGPADGGDRGRRPGRLLRAQAAVQRPVRRLAREAGQPVEGPGPGPGPDRQIRRADRQGARDARGERRHRPGLRHHGLGAAGRRRARRDRRRGHRPAHPGSAGHRDHRGQREEDRPLRHRARGPQDLGLRAPS